MNKIIALFVALFATAALAAGPSPCYWSGTYVKCFPTAGISGVDGTVSLPAYTFTSDPDSGFYRIGANDLGIAVNGAVSLEVTTTGVKTASVTWTDTTKGIIGTATNDVAAAGYVGEFIENNFTGNHALTTATNETVETPTATGITLTAGCWDINGQVIFAPAAGTSISSLTAWVGTATGTSTTGRDLNRNYVTFATAAGINGGNNVSLIIPTFRVNISGSTTYYLKTANAFTLSTMTVNGNIRATRVR